MAASTPIHGFNLSVVGGDLDAWGGFLNDNWLALDTLLAIDITATFLPVAGGTMVGQITLAGGGTGDEAVTVDEADAAASAAAGVVQVNLDTHEANLGNPHAVTAAQILALALAGGTMTGQIELLGGGSGLEAATAAEVALKADSADSFLTGLTTVDDIVSADRMTIKGTVILGVDVIASATNITLSMTGASKKTILLVHETTITVQDEVANQTVELWITQGIGIGFDATFVGVDKWIGGDPPDLTFVDGDIDIIVFSVDADGSTVIGQHIGVAS